MAVLKSTSISNYEFISGGQLVQQVTVNPFSVGSEANRITVMMLTVFDRSHGGLAVPDSIPFPGGTMKLVKAFASQGNKLLQSIWVCQGSNSFVNQSFILHFDRVAECIFVHLVTYYNCNQRRKPKAFLTDEATFFDGELKVTHNAPDSGSMIVDLVSSWRNALSGAVPLTPENGQDQYASQSGFSFDGPSTDGLVASSYNDLSSPTKPQDSGYTVASNAFTVSSMLSLEIKDTNYVDPGEYSSNPIWCMLDLMTNTRYGLGNFMSVDDFDLSQLVRYAAYCDELVDDGRGGQEKRFTMDVVIDSRVGAMDLISQLSSSFRGMPFYSAGKINLKIDMPVEESTQGFTMGNIIKDSFTQKWKSVKERYNIVEVQFLDRDKDYAQETVLVLDEESLAAGEEQKILQLRIFVTNISAAIREGRYAIKVSKFINKMIGFKTQINGIVAQPGDRIDLSHDVPQIGASGKVVVQGDSSTTKVYLDRSVVIESGPVYKLKIFFRDDTSEESTVVTGAGTVNVVTVSPAFTQIATDFEDYIFGKENILVMPLRIVNIERDNADNVSIGAVEYIEEVYDDDVIVIPETKFSDLNTNFPTVTGLHLNEFTQRSADGILSSNIEVWFSPPNPTNNPVYTYDRARIYIKESGATEYTLVGETVGNYFKISDNINLGTTYNVAVVAVTKDGRVGSIDDAPKATITIHGVSVPAIDLFGQNLDYKLTDAGIIQSDLYDRTYTRPAIALNTSTVWEGLNGQDWDGLNLESFTVEAMGSIEIIKGTDLVFLSTYTFEPTNLFQNLSGGTITVQISHSEDGETYTGFADLVPGDGYFLRYVRFKYILNTSDTSKQVILYDATIAVTSPPA